MRLATEIEMSDMLRRVDRGPRHALDSARIGSRHAICLSQLIGKGLLRRIGASTRRPENYVVTINGSYFLGVFSQSEL